MCALSEFLSFQNLYEASGINGRMKDEEKDELNKRLLKGRI